VRAAIVSFQLQPFSDAMSISRIEKIISGGQTGADRAAFDWAIENGISDGGWCPMGRGAEDGIISERYQLEETPDSNYEQRTMRNVRDADATLIVTLNGDVTGGSLLAREYARQIGKLYLHVNPTNEWRERIKEFLESSRFEYSMWQAHGVQRRRASKHSFMRCWMK
jgi:hypothetical protein